MDREAFILSFWRYAYGLAHKYKHLADVDDLAQEALLAVCLVVSRAEISSNPDAYVHRAMVNAVYVALRNSHLIKPEFAVKHNRHEDEAVYDCLSLSPIDEETIAEESGTVQPDWQWLYDLVNQLSTVQRRAIGYSFGLVGFGKLQLPEIAEKLGCHSYGSITNARDRALSNLRRSLDPAYQPRKRCNEALKATRIARGWTTVQVGKLLQMNTPRNYERWEREGVKPSEKTMAKLCELFGKPCEELGFNSKNGNE